MNYFLIFFICISTHFFSFSQFENAITIGAESANNPPDNTVNLYLYTDADYGRYEATSWQIVFVWESNSGCNENVILSSTTMNGFPQTLALDDAAEINDPVYDCMQQIKIGGTIEPNEYQIITGSNQVWQQIEIDPNFEVSDLEIHEGTVENLNEDIIGETNISMVLYDENFMEVKQAIGPIDQGPLPVNLLKFSATKKEEATHLSWVTASELKNDHFLVQRSTDGENYETIGKVKGAGTTVSATSYEFIDEKPSKGMNYYRLNQVDTDGSATLSPVRNVYFGIDKLNISILPNPTTDFVLVDMSSIDAGLSSVDVVIYDTNGAEVLKQKVENYTDDVKIDFNNLYTGAYILKVVTESSEVLFTEKVIKQ